MRHFTAISVLFFLTGCADFPELNSPFATPFATDNAAHQYPTILPLDGLLAGVPPAQNGLGVGNLATRLARLNARAAALAAHPVIDASTRRRMRAALGRHR